jgi:hypothetical protein
VTLPTSTARTATGLGVALVFLAQTVGLQVLCFCGACPLSHALGVGAPEVAAVEAEAPHACCHGQDAAEPVDAAASQLAADVPCCGDRHTLTTPAATLPVQHTGLVPTPDLASVALPPALVEAKFHTLAVATPRSARGPPDAHTVPLYLRQAALLI